MSQRKYPEYVEETEMSLKELIDIFLEYYREVISNWKIIPLIVLPIAGYLLYVSFTTPPIYEAELTFMLNDDQEQSQGLESILGLIGAGGGEYNLNKIMQLSQSRKIIYKTLFEKATVDGIEDYFANHIIREYKFNTEVWEMDQDFHFTNDSTAGFNSTELYALKCIYEKVVGFPKWNTPGLMSNNINDQTGILALLFNTTSEELSIAMTIAVYNHLSKFFVEKTVEKQRQTYEIMLHQSDSLQTTLANKEYELAKFVESHRNLILPTKRLREEQLKRDVFGLNEIVAGSVVNLGMAEFTLLNKTPFVILIDEPVSPIYPARKSKSKALVLAIILGAFLGIAYIVGRKILIDVMNPKEEN